MVSRRLTRPNTNDDPWRTNPVSWWLSGLEQPSPITLLCVRDGHLGHLLWGRRSLWSPTDKLWFLVFFLRLSLIGERGLVTWSTLPVQQGPARSNSTGPSHSSLSECGVPSIHQLCQPLPPLRPETVHIQASLHSSHTLKLLTATLMFLFIRPFITLEVKIQMHNHLPYDNPFPTVKGKTSGIKCTWNCAGLFLFVYAGLGGSKCQFSSITLYSTKKCLKVSLLITITQSRGFRIMPSITP